MRRKTLLAVTILGLMFCAGCAGVGVSPAGAGAPIQPTPPATPHDITAINHVVFMLQENRSFDSYFGQMGAYRAANGYGSASDVDGLPAGATNPADDGSTVGSFHFHTSCIENISPDWLESHADYHLYDAGSNVFLGNGFVHTATGMAGYSGQVTTSTQTSGSFMVQPTDTTNYYLFGSTTTNSVPGWGLPLASILVTVNGSQTTANAAHVPTAAGVTFTASATTINKGDTITLSWSVPNANQVMINSWYDQQGRRAMGYYDGTDLPYYYFMASNFASSDRWFAPMSGNSNPNHVYLFAATTHGHAHDPGSFDSSQVKNIFQLLDQAGVSWKIYSHVADPTTHTQETALSRFQPFASQHTANIVPDTQFLADAQSGALPSVAFIEENPGFDEHPGGTLSGNIHSGNSVQQGAQYAAQFINALMSGPNWKDSVFVLTFDEGGGFYDHVSPQTAVSPDGIPPQDLEPKDVQYIQPAADFNRTGFRVPLIVASPFAKKNYVSHNVADYTAILKFIETRFKLPHLTARDAAQMDMTEFFDFVTPPWMTPPTPPQQPVTMPCDFTNLR